MLQNSILACETGSFNENRVTHYFQAVEYEVTLAIKEEVSLTNLGPNSQNIIYKKYNWHIWAHTATILKVYVLNWSYLLHEKILSHIRVWVEPYKTVTLFET